MKYLITILVLLSHFSCGSDKKTETITDYLSFPEDKKLELINQSPLSLDTDHSKATSLVEPEYGMVLSMFADGKFYYNIDGLGEGAGF